MSQIWDLATENRVENYGSFYTSLFLMEGSSSDPGLSPDGSITPEARDMLMGVPVLYWEPPSDAENNILEAVTLGHARAIDAVEVVNGTLPLKRDSLEGVNFSLTNNRLRLESKSRWLGLFGSLPFVVDPRLAWFMEGGKTLGICIKTSKTIVVSSITSDDYPPRISVHNGILESKSSRGIIDYSARWKNVYLYNHSLFSDAQSAPDHHYRAYGASPEQEDLPSKISYKGACLGCGAAERSNEHCVPNWVAAKQKSKPVTAPVFCVSCNNHFGEVLELPLAKSSPDYVTAKSSDDPLLFSRWALKTAFTLSAASDILIQPEWMRVLRNGEMPEGFEVFASGDCSMRPGYMFAVTHFSQSEVKNGTFVFSFWMNNLAFFVVRKMNSLHQIPVLPRVYPSRIAPQYLSHGGIDFTKLHAKIIERITGEALDFTKSNPKKVKSRRE